MPTSIENERGEDIYIEHVSFHPAVAVDMEDALAYSEVNRWRYIDDSARLG
jgi:hypothetical protein